MAYDPPLSGVRILDLSSGPMTAVGRLFADSGLARGLEELEEKHPAIRKAQSVTHLGSLGGGNHFIEVCLDEEERVWAMLHSGSRGIGNRIGSHFIAAAGRCPTRTWPGSRRANRCLRTMWPPSPGRRSSPATTAR